MIKITAQYATPLELARYLNIESTLPDRKTTGSARGKEEVGTGDGSTTLFYLDKAYVIADSYSLHYGAAESSATALTETTHYTLNKDNGTVTLTSAGVTLIDVSNIYASYSYSELELTNTQLQDSLDRAEDEVDKLTGTHFADGTEATPDYKKVTEEKKTGKGKYDRDYYLDNFPLPNLVTSVATSALTTSSTAITVADSDGFPLSGYLLIDSDKIKYTGKDTAQHIFLGCSNLTASHSIGATVIPNVVEISTTSSGTKPTWSVLALDEEFDIDYDTGRIHLYKTDYDLTYYALQYPPRSIPNRFRCTYVYGRGEIPNDIKRLILMLATKDLLFSAARKSLLSGHSIDRIENYLIDEEWIKLIIEKYKSRKMSNT